MRSLLDVPGNDEDLVGLADWAETACLFKADGTISQEDLAREVVRAGDFREEKARLLAQGAFAELADRMQSIGTQTASHASYPFSLVGDNDVLELSAHPAEDDSIGIVYLFLLGVTRASMDSQFRVHAGIDPTKVFERLCADALLTFWGGRAECAESFIVGTSRSDAATPRFPDVVTELCRRLGEGEGWAPHAHSPRAGDGGLDIAVWRRFRDSRPSALVGFAQCKTGDHWRDYLGQRRPRAFVRKHMLRPLRLDPIRVFMVPCRINIVSWNDHVDEDDGILFDRCRITQYSCSVAASTLSDCRKWLRQVIRREGQGRGPGAERSGRSRGGRRP